MLGFESLVYTKISPCYIKICFGYIECYAIVNFCKKTIVKHIK